MLAGAPYRPGDPELAGLRAQAQRLMKHYNTTTLDDAAERRVILDKMLGHFGEGSVIRTPFSVDYGAHIHVGRDVFLNYGVVILDVCEVHIGDATQIGPAVQIYAADHPRDAASRSAGLECGKPVSIGRNVWIGGGAIILPGVTVGDDAIVAAGAVVTRNVGAGTTVKGNPARP